MKDRLLLSPPSHPLSESLPGDEVEVRSILFGGLRMRFARGGVRVGGRLRVVGRSPQGLRISTAGGESFEVEAPFAAFVEVRPVRRSDHRPLGRSSSGDLSRTEPMA